MSIVSRGQIATIGDTIQLSTIFRSAITGEPVDLDAIPSISITEPSGNVIFSFTTLGVYRLATGIYGFDYIPNDNPSLGVWEDNWRGTAEGRILYNTHNFVIHITQAPRINSDGYVALGDEVPFKFSQNAIQNINKLLVRLKARLNSSGKAYVKDASGNTELVDCDIYTVQQLVIFLIGGLDMFNMIPFFTEFTFEDSDFFNIFGEMIVRGALIGALASKALIERGREMTINDNGTSFAMPQVSDILNTSYSTEYDMWKDNIVMIKNSMRGSPLGLTSWRQFNNPAWARLRHLKERRIMY